MFIVDDHPLLLVLTPQMCKYHWLENGSAWRFPDANFMEARETLGLDSHVIHFHSRYYKKRDKKPGLNNLERILIKEGPVVQFYNMPDLIHFRMLL